MNIFQRWQSQFLSFRYVCGILIILPSPHNETQQITHTDKKTVMTQTDGSEYKHLRGFVRRVEIMLHLTAAPLTALTNFASTSVDRCNSLPERRRAPEGTLPTALSTSVITSFSLLLPGSSSGKAVKNTTRQQRPEEMEGLVKLRYDAVLETFGFLKCMQHQGENTD
jgi:hypothetical protein